MVNLLYVTFFPQRLPLRRIHRAGGDAALPIRRADIAITSIDTNITILIDVTIAAHNCTQRNVADYSLGHAASHRAAEKHRLYGRDFDTNVPSARLVIFAVDDLGAIYCEAHQLLLLITRDEKLGTYWDRCLSLSKLPEHALSLRLEIFSHTMGLHSHLAQWTILSPLYLHPLG